MMSSSERPSFDPSVLIHLPPGTRLGLAVSGGADSVGLLRIAHRLADERGWRLQVLHVEHGLRGEAGGGDARFVEALARDLGLPFHMHIADAGAAARERGLGVEEGARVVRYTWFSSLLGRELDAIATGHTLDDQAETVAGKLLRGAWTAGLAGIYPVVAARDLPGGNRGIEGMIVRPLLTSRRAAIREFLQSLGQTWCEDETNADERFTRNRIRAHLLPVLTEFNPRVSEHLAQIAVLAREDEEYWLRELARVMPGLLLPGRPVRGGGRSSSTQPGERSVAIEVERLRALPAALRSRVVRAAAEEIGPVGLGFDETERTLRLLDGSVGSTPRREQLSSTMRVERTPRELRLIYSASPEPSGSETIALYVPGEASGFGVRLQVEHVSGERQEEATLRAALPADRVRLRYSSGAPKRVKEVMERMGIPPPDRIGWPVLVWKGEIVWVRGAVLEPTPISSQLRIREL